MYTTLKSLGKHVIQTNLFKSEERLFSNICADQVWNKEEKYRILYFEAGSSWEMLQRKICYF